MSNFGEQFLHQKDPKLHTSSSVEHEMKRRKTREGRKQKDDRDVISQKPADKISNWMDVLEQTQEY
jgi:hypothetical protein